MTFRSKRTRFRLKILLPKCFVSASRNQILYIRQTCREDYEKDFFFEEETQITSLASIAVYALTSSHHVCMTSTNLVMAVNAEHKEHLSPNLFLCISLYLSLYKYIDISLIVLESGEQRQPCESSPGPCPLLGNPDISSPHSHGTVPITIAFHIHLFIFSVEPFYFVIRRLPNIFCFFFKKKNGPLTFGDLSFPFFPPPLTQPHPFPPPITVLLKKIPQKKNSSINIRYSNQAAILK